MLTNEEKHRLLAAVIAGGCGAYLKVRMLPDDTVAVLHDLMYTRSIMLNCDKWGFEKRFLF